MGVTKQLFRAFNEANSFMISSKSAFSLSSISLLIKARSHNLPWLIVSHWSLVKDRWLLAIHTVIVKHYLQSNSKNVRKIAGRDNFTLHDFNFSYNYLPSTSQLYTAPIVTHSLDRNKGPRSVARFAGGKIYF